MQGIILFAHGARDPRWALPFQAVADQLRLQCPDAAVALAFLEFMTPDIGEAGATLVDRGCTSVAILPLFLGTGGHVRNDLPLRVDALRAQHPAVRWTLLDAAGEAPEVTRALAGVAASALAQGARSEPPQEGPG